MALISLQDIVVAFGGPRILDGVSFQLEKGERVALLGRNGTGKSTLLKMMAGLAGPDDGVISWQKGIEVAYLPQEVPGDLSGEVFDIVSSGLGARGKLLSDYHHVSHQLHTAHTPDLLRRLDGLQAELDRTQGWEINNQVEHIISKMNLVPEGDFTQLSGGQRRRVLLARALVLKPDILLLDEPTNHLDIDSINWLEGFLKNYPGTVFFVTHDRQFMEHVTTRIMELDRGRLMSWSCDYRTFLERKQLALTIEAAQREDFDKKLAAEEIWIRRGVEARRCRNEGRVKALERMRLEKQAQRRETGQVRFRLQETDPSGHLVMKASRLGLSFADRCLIRDFSTNIMRGDRIGLIGPNGSGKTSLLRILLGKMAPSKGTVRCGTNLEIVYYDQLREQLDEEKTVMENVAGNGDTVTINGKLRHVIGYLQNFLFPPDRARTPVKVLSGGERNRLLLARLFTRPSNVLVMDEPTNDLDIETLELLEELLMDYSGTLLLVSHDRAFLNNVVTSTIVLEGEGEVNEYPGGYDEWLSQRKEVVAAASGRKKNPVIKKEDRPRAAGKLSYKEARELESLPARIEELEWEQAKLCSLLADPEFYRREPPEIADARGRSEAVACDLAEAYRRWEELELLKQGGA